MSNQYRDKQEAEWFTGDAKLLKSGSTLAQEDLTVRGLKTLTVKIVGVKLEDLQVPNSSKTETKPVMYFKAHPNSGVTKEKMVLNSINRERLMDLFGERVAAWRDRYVAVYVDPNVRFGAKRTGGLRINTQLPEADKKAHDNDRTLEPAHDPETGEVDDELERKAALVRDTFDIPPVSPGDESWAQ